MYKFSIGLRILVVLVVDNENNDLMCLVFIWCVGGLLFSLVLYWVSSILSVLRRVFVVSKYFDVVCCVIMLNISVFICFFFLEGDGFFGFGVLVIFIFLILFSLNFVLIVMFCSLFKVCCNMLMNF